MGAARSGSTILGVTLGNCDGAVYAGELDLYPTLRGRPTTPCTSRTEFWENVRRELDEAGYRPRTQWRAWFEHPRSLVNGGHFRNAGSYRAFNRALMRAVASEARVGVIVDSSHHPLRRLRLGRLPLVDFCTVYLVRDPVDVVQALQTDISPKRKAAANVYVWTVGILSEAVFRLVPAPKLRVRFEDFLADPSDIVSEIASQCPGVDPSGVNYAALSTGVPIAGNRIVREATVAIRASARTAPRDWTRWAQLPWRILYGYRW